ncbi:MAG: restriction endonuclease [Desulfobacterales bacterium]|nr:restriction endonuclease [Desulfobacterales bacterium]MDD4072639.1 restriction endonuclease [Desulfobacterales bacterium]MDD4391465.1 restriction endonuclease [Desulfobacterales bacterium]
MENIVAAIERSLNIVPGTKVIPNASIVERISAVPRQVDVYLEIPTGPRTLRIGVEVKDEAAPVDLPEIEQLIVKLKKLDLDYGCIVSRVGFTKNAREEAERHGIELRTLAQVEKTNWWLPSAMTQFHQQVELLRLQVNFHPEELESVNALLAPEEISDLVLTLANGESGTLLDYIKGEGVEALNRPELAHLKDQDIFAANILFNDLHSSLECAKGTLPLPQNVYARYRYHYRIESVKLTAYERSDGINAFTGISNALGKQVTVVAKLKADGSRTLTFTMDDPKPSKISIPPRGEVVDNNKLGTDQTNVSK